MVVIIKSPDLTHKTIADSEVFCFNHDRLKIAFKGNHHLHQTKDDVAMIVKPTDVSAIAKLLSSRGIPFSTEHIKSEKDVKYVSPQISLTSEFVTNPDTDLLEQEVDMLIDVIDKYRNIHELIIHINNQVFLNYSRQIQTPSQPYIRPVQYPGVTGSNVQQQPHDPGQNLGMTGSNFQSPDWTCK